MQLKDIRDLVSANELENAIDQIKPFAEKVGMEDDFDMISTTYEDLEDEIMTSMDSLPYKEKIDRKSKIKKSIMRLISKIEKKQAKESGDVLETKGENNITVTNTKNSNISIGGTQSVAKKKVLFIYSNPTNKNQLDFGAEIRRIKDALLTSPSADRDKYEIVVEEAVEDSKVFRTILNEKPDYLHISLHASKKKGLLFQDKNGQEHPVSSEELSDFFALYVKRSPKIECAVFSACNSETVAKAVQPFVKNAIGTRDLFPDEAAVIFARKFYEAIFDGEDIEIAFDLAVLELKYSGFEQEEDEMLVHEIPALFTNN